MSKSPDAFRTISEVAEWLGVQAHVLRFWESKFSQVKPVKRAGGRRYYRPSDMQLLGGIKNLLYDEGVTIKGVQKIIREQGVAHVSSLAHSLDEPAAPSLESDGADILQFETAPIVDVAPPPPTDEPSPPVSPEPVMFRHDPVAPEPVIQVDPEISVEPDPVTPSQPETPRTPAPEQEPPQPVSEEHPAPDAEHPAPYIVAPSEPEIAADPDAPAPPLPSFLHRPPAPEAPAETEAPRARSVDAPDPVAESQLPYTPGTLAHLARITRLSPDQANHVTPVAAELRGFLNRVSAQGTA